jgi:single-stranded-DNA-specific exonuclease
MLQRSNRTYWCRREGDDLVVRNNAGEELRRPLTGHHRTVDGADAKAIDLSERSRDQHPYVRSLLDDAALALGLAA